VAGVVLVAAFEVVELFELVVAELLALLPLPEPPPQPAATAANASIETDPATRMRVWLNTCRHLLAVPAGGGADASPARLS
jgi:hypothetical protein